MQIKFRKKQIQWSIRKDLQTTVKFLLIFKVFNTVKFHFGSTKGYDSFLNLIGIILENVCPWDWKTNPFETATIHCSYDNIMNF